MTGPGPANGDRIKVLFWAQGDQDTPSSRERLYKLLPLLGERGIDAVAPPQTRSLTARTALSFLRPVLAADVVFIQKRLMPPRGVALLKRLRPIVYDFDDALYAPGPSYNGSASIATRIPSIGRRRRRLAATLRYASLVIAGNEELARFATGHSSAVRVIPTSVSVGAAKKEHADAPTITIGWTGTAPNLAYLRGMPSVLERLNRRLGGAARLRVVCSKPLASDVAGVEFKPWSLADETADLLSFDIGVMPLGDDDWTRGKCAFKLLQYASVGLAVVASPVGANTEAVKAGESGFFASTEEEWVDRLENLARSAVLRRSMGERGREHVRRHYAPEHAADRVAEAIRAVAPSRQS